MTQSQPRVISLAPPPAEARAGPADARAEPVDTLAFVFTLIFAFCMYSSIVNLIPALDVVRPALAASAIAGVAFFGRRLLTRTAFQMDWKVWVLLSLGALAWASISWSVNPEATRAHSQELTKDCLSFLLVVGVVTNARRLRSILAACALAALVPDWGALANYINKTNLIEGTRASWLGVYQDPNHMAMSMVFLVPVGLTLVLSGKGWLKGLGVVSLAGSLTAIGVSGSRGGFIGLCLATLVWIAREPKKMRSVLAFAAAAMIFLAWSPQMFWNRTQTIADYHTDESALGRVHAWEVGKAISVDRPLLGVGGGAFIYAWPTYAPVDARGKAYWAHNVFLAMVAETGWIGFLLFALLVAGCLDAAFRAGSASDSGPWIRAIYAGALGYLVCDMSAGYVTSAHFFFIFGLLAATARIRASEGASPGAVFTRAARHLRLVWSQEGYRVA
jgi:O-antigen ligase